MANEIEYTPAHIANLERAIAELKEQKRVLTNSKIGYEKSLTELKAARKANRRDKQCEATILQVKERLSDINAKILELNTKISEKAVLKQDIQQELKDKKLLKATPREMREYQDSIETDSALRLKLIALRDKYIVFTGDHTRIASKRLMAGEFVKEIDEILKNKRPA